MSFACASKLYDARGNSYFVAEPYDLIRVIPILESASLGARPDRSLRRTFVVV